jgi:hypothetical protein
MEKIMKNACFSFCFIFVAIIRKTVFHRKSTMPSPPSSEDPWVQAVQAGDVIRRRMAEENIPQHSAFVPPGIGEGVLAAAGTALLSWPLRRGLFRLLNQPNNKQFQIFLELVVTPLQALVVVQAGLLVGSVCGSHHYLQQFLQLQQEQRKRDLFSEPSFVQDVCRELMLPGSGSQDNTVSSIAITGWTSQQILQTYRQVLQNCQRNE